MLLCAGNIKPLSKEKEKKGKEKSKGVRFVKGRYEIEDDTNKLKYTFLILTIRGHFKHYSLDKMYMKMRSRVNGIINIGCQKLVNEGVRKKEDNVESQDDEIYPAFRPDVQNIQTKRFENCEGEAEYAELRIQLNDHKKAKGGICDVAAVWVPKTLVPVEHIESALLQSFDTAAVMATCPRSENVRLNVYWFIT